MVLTVSADDVAPKNRYSPTAPDILWTTEYIGGAGLSAGVPRGPQAFMNDLRGPHTIKPHFHLVDQFQIFVEHPVRIGKDVVEPILVHYTDGYTPYGPVIGDEGIHFFNLRPRADIGAHMMPGSKDKLLRNAGRHRTGHCAVRDPRDAGTARHTFLIEPEDDGLCAFETTAGPGRRLPADIAHGSGRYELVLAGSLVVDGKELPAESLIWVSGGEQLPARCAGAVGAHVLTVQAPLD